MLPRHIWSFCVKCVGINTGEPPKWVAPELRSVVTGCVADRMIHAPSHMCYPAKFGTSATRVFAYIEGNPKKWGLLGPRPHWGVRRGWPSKTKPHPHVCYQVCYQVKIGSAPSKGVCTNRREPPKLGSTGAPPPCGRDVADTVEIRPPHMCYPTEFGRSRSHGTSVIREIHLQNLTPRVPLFKVTQCHRNRHGSIRHL